MVKNEPPFNDLKIEKHTISVALVDLTKEGYIISIETSVSGSGYVRTFAPQSVLPLGAHFHNSNQRFKRKSFWKGVEEVPKKYWFIGILITLFASLGFNVKSIIEYFLKK